MEELNDAFEQLMETCSPMAIEKATAEDVVFQYKPTCACDGENIVVIDKNDYNGKVVARYPIRELLSEAK